MARRILTTVELRGRRRDGSSVVVVVDVLGPSDLPGGPSGVDAEVCFESDPDDELTFDAAELVQLGHTCERWLAVVRARGVADGG